MYCGGAEHRNLDKEMIAQKEDGEMASTKDVVGRHLEFFGKGDLKGILSDYAPGAVLFTPDGPLNGADAIRPFFQAMIAEFGKPGSAFSMKQSSPRVTMLTSCGPQRLLTTCTSWARTRSSFGTVRSWPSHSRARLRPRAEKTPSFREAAQQSDQADRLRLG